MQFLDFKFLQLFSGYFFNCRSDSFPKQTLSFCHYLRIHFSFHDSYKGIIVQKCFNVLDFQSFSINSDSAKSKQADAVSISLVFLKKKNFYFSHKFFEMYVDKVSDP